jgi:hypothetical protein
MTTPFRALLCFGVLAVALLFVGRAGAENCERYAPNIARAKAHPPCAELKQLKQDFDAVLEECRGDSAFMVGYAIVQAQLLSPTCKCESAERTIAAANSLDLRGLAIEALLENLGQLRSIPGECKTGENLVAYRHAEKALKARIGELEPEAVCETATSNVERDGPRAAPTDVFRCLGCDDARRKRGLAALKRKGKPPRVCAPEQHEKALAALDVALTSLSDTIRTKEKCDDDEQCQAWQLDRLRVLTEFLTLFSQACLTEESRKKYEQLALNAIRSMGLPPDALEMFRNHSTAEVIAMAQLGEAVNNQELRNYLIAQFRALSKDRNGFAPLVDALAQGASLKDLLERAKGMTPEERSQFYRVAGAVGFRESAIRSDYLDQIISARFDVILPEAASPNGNCATCCPFWGKLKAELNSAQHPKLIYAKDVKASLEQRLRLRQEICEGKTKSTTEPGCGPVLAVTALEVPGAWLMTPQLNYVRRRGATAVVSTIQEVPAHRFASNATRTVQEGEAVAMASAAVYGLHQLLDAPTDGGGVVPIPVAECGTRVVVDPIPPTRPPEHATLRFMSSECKLPQFRDRFNTAVHERGLTKFLTLEAPKHNVNAPRKGRGTLASPYRCDMTLTVIRGKASEPIYSLSATTFSAPKCEATDKEKWESVADESAHQLTRFFGSRMTVQKPPPYWHSLYFSGARQLEHSGGRSGWAWALGEVGLLATGTVLASLAVNARNDSGRGSSDSANKYLLGSYGAFLLVLPLRLVSGAVCCDEERSRR